MNFNFVAIIFLVTSAIISYLFLSFRDKTTKKQMDKKEYKIHVRGRILTVFFFHLIFIFGGSIFAFIVFLLTLNGFDPSSVVTLQNVYFCLFFIGCLFISYGSGVYLTAVISEKQVKKKNDTDTETNPILLFYNDYFHGPFSHVMAFVGFAFVLIILSFVEISFSKPISFANSFHLYGIIFGAMFFYWIIKNLTWKHQFPWFITISIIYFSSLYLLKINIENYIFCTFNFYFLTTLNILLSMKYLFYKKKRGEYRYNFKLDEIAKHLKTQHETSGEKTETNKQTET